MHGVTTALVGFIFTCVVFPHLIKNRPQFYAAFASVCGIIVFDALAYMINATEIGKFRVFAYVACAFLQVLAIILLFLSAGGITWRTMAGDMKEAFEVIRRGGEEKEVIIPLSGEMARLKAQRQAEREEPEKERIVINTPPKPPPPTGNIPLEP